MRRCPILVIAMIGSAALAGCSSSTPPAAQPSGGPATTTATSSSATPGAVGRSPVGVTTAVDAPAESTEEEYFQACHAATTWMIAKGGNPRDQFEPYLAEVQRSDQPGPGTFNVAWSTMPPGRRAAVIVAAEAASNGLCG